MGVLEHDKTEKVKLDATNAESAVIAAKTEWEKIKKSNFFKPHEVHGAEVIQSFYIAD